MKIIVEIRGGLGNQLFCYAFGYAMAKENDAKYIIDTSMNDTGIHRKLELLNYQVEYNDRISIIYSTNNLFRCFGYNYIRRKLKIGLFTKTYETRTAYISYKPIEIQSDTYFRGYWQNWRYFDNYRDKIVNMLKPTFEVSRGFINYKNQIRSTDSVAVHFRRGDYTKFGLQLKDEYYIKALKMMQNDKSVYYIFSDALSYCRVFLERNFPNYDFVIVDYESNNKTIEDMLLMSECNSMIIANSSYSWWAAYMNQKTRHRIICPVYKEWKKGFYLNSWKTINVEE